MKLTHVDESESFLDWPHEYLDKLVDIDGVFCIPVKMIDEKSTQPSLSQSSFLELANISSIKDLLTDLYKANTQSKNTRLPSTSIYYSVEVKTLLSVKIISSETARQDGKWTCKICLKYVSPNRMLCHVGKHIISKGVKAK